MPPLLPCALAAATLLLAPTPAARADSMSFVASRDNSIFEDVNGTLSSGAGPLLFSGRSGPMNAGLRKRALLAFDLSALPAQTVVQSATLTLYLVLSNPFDLERTHTLHRVSKDWGEGGSVALGGAGSPAQTDDATWTDTFFGTQGAVWDAPGADFDPAVSAAAAVNEAGLFYDWTAPGLAADVQAFFDDPGANFGWILVGDESTLTTAHAFASRENDVAARRPVLTVEFSVIPEPATGLLLACGLAGLAIARARG